ncbi:hypothetical protein BJ912DRAFT_1146430 [Pholiota molesta]|nr:hypothetical protein BJ912DRAFT_1146430 [Pholiota molesta]
MKGGILSAVNEEGEGLSWRYCMSASPAETRELLQDIGERHDVMKIPRPVSIIVDNCCQVRRFIREGLGADVIVNLDVYHFMICSVVFGGTKNKHRRHVLQDIRDAIIKTPAKANTPATYWIKAEQEIKITEAYNKWLQHGDVWSAAASKVHADQLEHVRKGCLARPREDISMDGSRIEGSHKGWNSIQRAQPSGIEMYTGLAHDFFLRRNIRIGSSRVENKRPINFHQFVASTYGSHHIQLVNYTAELFNSLYIKEPSVSKASLQVYPILPKVQVNKASGLVESAHSVTFGGFMEIKDEASDTGSRMLEDIDAEVAEMDQDNFMLSLGVEERLFSIRMVQNAVSQPSRTGLTSLQKRKERGADSDAIQVRDTPPASGLVCVDDIVPDPKRRRFAGSLSPGTVALGLPIGTPGGPPDSESDALGLSKMPEPHNFSMENCAPFVDCAPTNMVVDTDVSLPNPSSTTDKDTASTPRAFFKFQTTLDKSFPKSGATVSSASSQPASVTLPLPPKPSFSLDMLRRPLQLPAELKDQGLTRSQLLFSIGTTVDPRALRILGDDEFYLFMDMRAELQWISFSMTSSKWAIATKAYNERLAKLGKEKHFNVIKKNPRALMDKLNEIEPMISERLGDKDFISKSNGSDAFWLKHCNAIPALKKEDTDDGQKKRKDAVCTRCKAIMYIKSRTINHRRGYCSDGVASKQKPGPESDPLPEWPQPQDIFTAGKSFDPATFLITVRDLYQKVIDHTVRNPNTAVEYMLEDEAFSRMLASRTTCIDGHTYFRLYSLDIFGSSFPARGTPHRVAQFQITRARVHSFCKAKFSGSSNSHPPPQIFDIPPQTRRPATVRGGGLALALADLGWHRYAARANADGMRVVICQTYPLLVVMDGLSSIRWRE